MFDIIIKRDFWHGDRKVGRNFVTGELGGYYNDLVAKTGAYNGPKSKEGVPLVNLGKLGYALHPVTICQVALGWYERWLQENSEYSLDRFLKLASWLAENQEYRASIGGVWPVPYSIPIYELLPGWVSALVQGQAISVLVRAHKITCDDEYLNKAALAVEPFYVDVNNGGVRSLDNFGNVFFEEYPSTPNSRVLNGFISSLWGLYDYSIWTKDSEIHDLFLQGIHTLTSSLNLYDTGFWSRYSLFHHPDYSNLASPYYHREHIAQLTATHLLVAEENLIQMAHRWESYMHNWINLTRVIVTKFYSRIRLLSQ